MQTQTPQQQGRETGLEAAMASFQQRVLFPTHIYHTNLSPFLSNGWCERLASLAIEKYTTFSAQARQQIPYITANQVNNGFFNNQKKNDFQLNNPQERAWWPELYDKSPDFPQLRQLMRASLEEYAKRQGLVTLGSSGADAHVTVLWAAVYPGVREGEVGGRHGYHTHEFSLASCVLYLKTSGNDSGPIAFIDPRGAAPLDDWERDKTEYDVQPTAPFHRNEYLFPEPGDVVCFPSWLVHSVPSLRKGGTRVVFSANLQAVSNKDSWLRTAVSK